MSLTNYSCTSALASFPFYPRLPYEVPIEEARENSLDLVRCVMQGLEGDVFGEDSPLSTNGLSIMDCEVFRLLLRESSTFCPQRTPEDRHKISLEIRSPFLVDYAPNVRAVLNEWPIDAKISAATDNWNSSLLIRAERSVGQGRAISFAADGSPFVHYSDDFYLRGQSDSERTELLALIQELLAAGSNLHQVSLRRTLLVEVVFEWCATLCDEYVEILNTFDKQLLQKVFTAVKFWLRQLNKAGVDLVEYGQEEQRLHLTRRVDKECWFNRLSICLIGFNYCTVPDDWQLYIKEAMGNSLAQFWYMVDHPELRIPGAWDTDDDSDYEPSDYDSDEFE